MFKASLSGFKIFAGVAAVLLVFLVTLGLSFRRFNELTNANDWDVHTYKVLLSTTNLMRNLVDIQSGARGFLQSGQEDFLEPYRVGHQEFSKHHAQTLQLTRDNPVQQKRLQLLKRQYDGWMNGHIEPLIKMRRATPDTLTAIRRAEPGLRQRKIIMDAMRQSVASIEAMEYQLLAQRTAREKTNFGSPRPHCF